MNNFSACLLAVSFCLLRDCRYGETREYHSRHLHNTILFEFKTKFDKIRH